jgi:hypothetical protein
MLFGDKQGVAEFYLELRERKDQIPPASLRTQQQGNALPEQGKTQDRRKKPCQWILRKEIWGKSANFLKTTLCITLESRFTCKKTTNSH